MPALIKYEVTNMLLATKHFLMERSRKKKYNELLTLLNIKEGTSILDIGVNDQEYSPVDNYFEKRYPHPKDITVLSVNELHQFPKRYPEISTVFYKGGAFPFKDKSFSVVISNAVIEHVGSRDDQTLFINEMLRVGQKIYFSTPAKEFPIEIHTNYPVIHWLPKHFFDQLVSFTGKKWASGNYMSLLSKKSLQQLLATLNATKYQIITHRLGFPLHYIVVAQ